MSMSRVFHLLPSSLRGFAHIQLQPLLRAQLPCQIENHLASKPFSTRSLRASPRRPTPRTALLLLRPRVASSQVRYYAYPPKFTTQFNPVTGVRSFIQQVAETYKEEPYGVSFALGGIVLACVVGLFFLYDELVRVAPECSKFPPAVAKPLRKALKYEKYSKNPKLAADYYQQTLWAINDCERSMGLDPFTPPILHLKMHIGLFLWDVLHYQLSIDFLEQIKRDCGRWLREYSILPGKKLQRTEVILFTVRLSVKIAELCVDDHMLELDKAEEHLVYAIETVMKESKRREEEGVTEVKEGPWLSDDEFGATLERLGHFYEAKDDHYLAAPLFLQAITKLNAKSCHMAVLMNNLSICLAQQVVPVAKGEKPVPRSTLVSNARAWSQKALEVAAKIQPPERDEECDLSCVVATHNLGEFAEMDGNIAEARKRYEEALSLARAIKFKEGITTADEALKRVYTKNMVTVTKT